MSFIDSWGDLFMGFGIGLFIASMLFISEFNNDGQELGQAICDQEYNMDYKSYDNQELKCKPKEIKKEKVYDGIIIQIGNE